MITLYGAALQTPILRRPQGAAVTPLTLGKLRVQAAVPIPKM